MRCLGPYYTQVLCGIFVLLKSIWHYKPLTCEGKKDTFRHNYMNILTKNVDMLPTTHKQQTTIKSIKDYILHNGEEKCNSAYTDCYIGK